MHKLIRNLNSLAALLILVGALSVSGCLDANAVPQGAYIWSRKGLDDGRLLKPRAITVDNQDRIFLVDKTGRIQSFDRQGKRLHGWRTPMVQQGKPVGLAISDDGLLMVADTHYFRVLFYTPEGELVESRTIGGTNGRGPGEFGFVTDIAQDSKGNYYVGEYGDYDRIQKFTPDGEYVCEFGRHGEAPGDFLRPQGIVMDNQDRLWVADACNHRIQVFDAKVEPPRLLFHWGQLGEEPGQLKYPYGLTFDTEGNLYVAEMGNHRIQKFDQQGRSLGVWGGPGREPGELDQPWGVAIDSQGSLHVVDTYNHRIQRFHFPSTN